MARDIEMGCERVLELLEAYVDGDLAPAEGAAVRRHLAACASCAAELELALAVKQGLRALPQPVCPPAVLAAVKQRGRAEVVPLRARRPAVAWVRWAAAAAILAAVASGLFFLMQPSRPATQTAEVERATYEARLALAYIGEASRKAGLSVRHEVFEERVVSPTARSLARMLPLAPPAEP
jgi:anti-sigma factor RsiW